MAITATLVSAGNNRLRYLLSVAITTIDTVTITSSGAATPDLKTDSLAGPIKALTNAPANGYGGIAAGSLTQTNARMLWLSDGGDAIGPSAPPTVGNLPTAKAEITPRTGTAANWQVDANVSGGIPTLVVSAVGAVGTAYLDVFVPGVIGA